MSRSSVDLPQPDGPMSETNSPASIERSIPVRAVTAAGPGPEHLADVADVDDRWRGRSVGHLRSPPVTGSCRG